MNWTAATGGPVGSNPSVVGDRVLVGSEDGHLYLLDATDGTELATAALGTPIRTGPVAVADEVYLGARNGSVINRQNLGA